MYSFMDQPSKDQSSKSPPGGIRTTARAFFVSERLNTSGLERGDVLATTPLAFRVNENGVAILFRYGVVVLIGFNALEEEEFLRSLQSRTTRLFARREEETATIELAAEREDQIPPGGPICLQSLTPERLILVGEALAKSAVLARHEREVAAVFDMTEPFARELAQSGRMRGGRRAILSRSAMRCRCGTGYRARLKFPKNPTSSGTSRSSSGFTPGWRTNTSSRNAR